MNMKKILLLFAILTSSLFAQSQTNWSAVGNSFSMRTVLGEKQLRINLGSPGYYNLTDTIKKFGGSAVFGNGISTVSGITGLGGDYSNNIIIGNGTSKGTFVLTPTTAGLITPSAFSEVNQVAAARDFSYIIYRNSALLLNEQGVLITDQTGGGARYPSKYRAGLTNRHIVDKEYVDSVANASGGVSPVFGNGVQTDGGITGLGGDGTWQYDNSAQIGGLGKGTVYLSPFSANLSSPITSGSGGFQVQSTGLFLNISYNSKLKSIEMLNNKFIVRDSVDNSGMKYAQKYRINLTNRSIIDKEAIDSLINQAITGYSPSSQIQNSTTPTSSTKGLSVDAANTALATKEPTITAGTASQYYRGDKSMQTLDKTAVGLPNVDNTSDIAKPVSTLQAAAIALKANDADVVHKAGSETITGAKNFDGGANFRAGISSFWQPAAGTYPYNSINSTGFTAFTSATERIVVNSTEVTFRQGTNYIQIRAPVLTGQWLLSTPDKSGVIATTTDVQLAGIRNITANLTVTLAMFGTNGTLVIVANAGTAAITVTVPASIPAGYSIMLKKSDATANTVTISGNSSTYNGNASDVISTKDTARTYQSTATSTFHIF